MAESIPSDKISPVDNKETEYSTETPIEKPPKKDSAVPQREKKKVPQKAGLYGRRHFYNRDYYRYEMDFRSSEDGEKVKGFRHSGHRGYWQNRNDADQWLNGDSETPRQYYHSKSAHSTDPAHHRRGKRPGHRSADPKQASLQDGVKERMKKPTQQELTSSITDKNGEKIVKEKTVEAEGEVEATKITEDQLIRVSDETMRNLATNENGEKVKRKPDVSKIEMDNCVTVELSGQNTDTTVAGKSVERKGFKKKPAVDKAEKTKTKTSGDHTYGDSPITHKRGEKTVKKKHANKDISKPDRSTAVKMSNQTDSSPHVKKEEKQKEPITADNDKAPDKEMVIMVGKYQVKKFKPISTPNVALADEDITGGAPNSKVTSDKTANQTASTHSHKRRVHYNKAMKGPNRHGRGIVASLQSDVLSQQLSTGQYECMVCCDRVRVKDPVWSCSTCYHIFHLKCIKKWAKIPSNIEEG